MKNTAPQEETVDRNNNEDGTNSETEQQVALVTPRACELLLRGEASQKR